MKTNVSDVETTMDSSNKTGSSKKLIQSSLFDFTKKIDTPISKKRSGEDNDISVLDIITPQRKNENSTKKTPRKHSNRGEIQPKKIKLEKPQNVVSDDEVSSSDETVEKNKLHSNLVNPLHKFIRCKRKHADEVTASNSEDFLLVAEELSQTLNIPIDAIENANAALTTDSLKLSSITEMTKTNSNDFDDKAEPEYPTPIRKGSSKEALDIKNRDTPEVSTLSSDLDKTPKSSRKVTLKQIQRDAEIIKRREEKEQKKLEKELLKANEKAEKEKMRKEKQEEKEKQKQAEIEAKEKKKEQERQKKEEERSKKEEERLKKEEEKIQQEEQERLKQEKAKQAFESFFTKRKSDSVTAFKDNEEFETLERFKPFCVKDNMRLAPLIRIDFNETRRSSMDSLLNGTVPAHPLYLEELKTGVAGKGKSAKTSWRVENEDDDVEIIEEECSDAESLVDNSEDVIVARDPLQNTNIHWKLLQFCENRRPAFWGTWTKTSSVVGPRRPLGKDDLYFDYDVDSDDEWEEEEPGESISDSEGEEQEPADDYEVDNEFFVPHGYLSDEEAEDEMEDLSPEARKEKLKIKEEDFAKELTKKTKFLKPSLVGCIWEDEIVSHSSNSHLNKILGAYRSVLCFPQPIHTSFGGVSPPFLDKISPADAADESVHEGKDKSGDIPREDMVQLIQQIHGFRLKKDILIQKFLDYWDSKYQGMEHIPKRPSKVKLVRILKEIASYGKCLETNFRMWVVNTATVKEYNIEGLSSLTLASSAPSASSKLEVAEEPEVTPAKKSLITMYTQSMTPGEARKPQENVQRKRASLVTLPRSSTSVTFGEKECINVEDSSKSFSPKNEVIEPPTKKKVAFVTLSSPQKSKGSSSACIPHENSEDPKEDDKKILEIVYLD